MTSGQWTLGNRTWDPRFTYPNAWPLCHRLLILYKIKWINLFYYIEGILIKCWNVSLSHPQHRHSSSFLWYLFQVNVLVLPLSNSLDLSVFSIQYSFSSFFKFSIYTQICFLLYIFLFISRKPFFDYIHNRIFSYFVSVIFRLSCHVFI